MLEDFRMEPTETWAIEIANTVNQAVCVPLAEQVAEEARAEARTFAISGDYADSIHTEVDERVDVKGYAHAYVAVGVDYGMQVEALRGTLTRALGRV